MKVLAENLEQTDDKNLQFKTALSIVHIPGFFSLEHKMEIEIKIIKSEKQSDKLFKYLRLFIPWIKESWPLLVLIYEYLPYIIEILKSLAFT
jgi:hypothetical protein